MYLINRVCYRNVLLLLLIFLIFSGCNNENTIWQEQDGFVCEVVIEFPIGSNIEPISGKRVSFLPNILSMVTIEHVSQTDSIYYWCISDYIPIRKKINARPLGVMKFRQENKNYSMVILNATEPAHQVLKVKSMEDFMTKYYAAELMLRDWFLHADPNKSRSFISWENEWYAIQLINTFQNP